MKHQLLVTGLSGLIGSEVVAHFHGLGWSVTGFDNNMRKEFFGAEGDTTWNERRLVRSFPNFRHMAVDIRNREAVQEQVKALKPGADLKGDCGGLEAADTLALSSRHWMSSERIRRVL